VAESTHLILDITLTQQGMLALTLVERPAGAACVSLTLRGPMHSSHGDVLAVDLEAADIERLLTALPPAADHASQRRFISLPLVRGGSLELSAGEPAVLCLAGSRTVGPGGQGWVMARLTSPELAQFRDALDRAARLLRRA